MMTKKDLWIHGTGMKEGALSKQLDIPVNENIPMSLLTRIKNAKIGQTVTNPTGTGRKYIKVTPLLKKRAVMAHTMKGFHSDDRLLTPTVIVTVCGALLLFYVSYKLVKSKKK